MARLTAEKWAEVKAKWCVGKKTNRELADEYGVSHVAIQKRAIAELWEKLNESIVDNAIESRAMLTREVTKVTKNADLVTFHVETEIDRLARRKVFAESVGDKLLKAVDDSIPLCEKPSDVKDLATAFKSVYEPMFKTAPDTAIQINNNQTPSIIERVIIDHEATN
jgi:hypothetical protein